MFTSSIILAIACAGGPETSPLAVIGRAPDVRLFDQNGRSFALGDHRGKVMLVSFVFTTCTGTCPATTSRMMQLQRALRMRRQWDNSIHFVSITLDPERDQPGVLRNYAVRVGADLSRWSFLTRDAEHVENTWRAWDMWAKRTVEGGIDHPSRIFLVDPNGRIREIYHLETMRPDVVLNDIDGLLGR